MYRLCLMMMDVMASLIPVLFSLVHFTVTSVVLRREPGGYQFSLNHPIASCSITITVSTSGSLITNLLLGRPLLDSVADEKIILAYVLIWYFINFSPGDTVFKLYSRSTAIKYFFLTLEEIRRSHNVMTGVLLAQDIYPNTLLPRALAGMFKGTGKKWSITFYRLLTGSNLASQHELLSLSFTTKAGFVLGLLYGLNHTRQFLSDSDCVVLGAVFLVSLQLYNLWYDQVTDPFKRPQEMMWSYLARSINETNSGHPVEGSDTDANTDSKANLSTDSDLIAGTSGMKQRMMTKATSSEH